MQPRVETKIRVMRFFTFKADINGMLMSEMPSHYGHERKKMQREEILFFILNLEKRPHFFYDVQEFLSYSLLSLF